MPSPPRGSCAMAVQTSAEKATVVLQSHRIVRHALVPLHTTTWKHLGLKGRFRNASKCALGFQPATFVQEGWKPHVRPANDDIDDTIAKERRTLRFIYCCTQVAIGTMLGENASLLVLDLSRNHLKKSAALSIADGLESNRSLTTLKLGWNNLGRWAHSRETV